MKKFSTQICMVSGQIIPNITPVLDEAIRPEKVILCASNAMMSRAEIMAKFFRSKQIEHEIFSLGYAYDFHELQERFLELATRFDASSDIAVNLTGGNKLMTIAAQMVFDMYPCFYVIPEKDQIIMLDANNAETYEIADKILLYDYFSIHGYTVEKQSRKKKINPARVQLAEKVLKQYDVYKNHLGRLNYLAAKAEDSYSLRVRNEISEGNCELLHLFYQQGSIKYYDDQSIEFRSAAERDYCKGFWLEDFIAAELHKVDEQVGLQDYASSIEIISTTGSRNELDAAFLYNNELYVIECKTARMDDKASDVLYKIDTIRGYAGLYTKSIIASFKELNKYDRQRAEDLNITLIEGRNLNRFAERIIDMLTPERGDK